ncbi:MAG: hypothetical protein ABI963_07120, partial [Rhizomicrobium sp.]
RVVSDAMDHMRPMVRAVIVAAILAMSGVMATSASAYIVCNHEGDCWHSERRESAPGQNFDYHPDD